jgi:hypothetical protein
VPGALHNAHRHASCTWHVWARFFGPSCEGCLTPCELASREHSENWTFLDVVFACSHRIHVSNGTEQGLVMQPRVVRNSSQEKSSDSVAGPTRQDERADGTDLAHPR